MLFGRAIGMPPLNHQINPETTGRNFIFLSSIGYIIATCMQSYNIQVWRTHTTCHSYDIDYCVFTSTARYLHD